MHLVDSHRHDFDLSGSGSRYPGLRGRTRETAFGTEKPLRRDYAVAEIECEYSDKNPALVFVLTECSYPIDQTFVEPVLLRECFDNANDGYAASDPAEILAGSATRIYRLDTIQHEEH
jgi:hypothetical protein